MIGIATILAVVYLIIVLIVNLSTNNNKVNLAEIDSELARAMTYQKVQETDKDIEATDNVKFDAFFLRDLDGDGYAEGIRGTCKELYKSDTLYMELKVQSSGELRNAKIEIEGKNFCLQTLLAEDEQLKNDYIGNNVKFIEFNNLTNGTQKLITGTILDAERVVKTGLTEAKSRSIHKDINNFSRDDNKIILTGTYVAENGEETQIRKEVNLTVDWYSKNIMPEIHNYISNESSGNEISSIIYTNTINPVYEIELEDKYGELPISSVHIEGIIPQFNGYDPIEVNKIYGDGKLEYDEDTKKFTIDSESEVSDTGIITKTIGNQINGKVKIGYKIKVTYPLEAYESTGGDTVIVEMPVKAYLEGFNNPNEEFTNPYKSEQAETTISKTYRNPEGSRAIIFSHVGDYIHTPQSRRVISKNKPMKIYNGVSLEEKDDTYNVQWIVSTGSDIEQEELEIVQPNIDSIVKTDSTKISMENFASYKGISFENANYMLGINGWIKVYDAETEELIASFTSKNWNNGVTIYERPVKNIKIKTSKLKTWSSLWINNIKEIDDEYITKNFTEEEFRGFKYIQSEVSATVGGKSIGKDTSRANYELPYGLAYITIDNNCISTQKVEHNAQITISTATENNSTGWKDGSFLVKLPTGILEIEINDIEISNRNVSILSSEIINVNGIKFIKINTQNNRDSEEFYNIKIDAVLTIDSRIVSQTQNIELYASNEDCGDYYYSEEDIYDVNNNLNITEKVNKTMAGITFISSNTLLTSETLGKLGDNEEKVVSPQIGDIEINYGTTGGEKITREIGIGIINNYTSTIRDIVILGKIPFKGNTTVLGNNDLGSTFTTKMTEQGIKIPEGLEGKVQIYYSTEETPNKNLTDETNRWKTKEEVENFDEVKTYLIQLTDVILERGANHEFTYTIEIPEQLEVNKVAYSSHAIYFSLDTEEGKYKTETESSRLGLRIAEKYDLEITKYQVGEEKLIPGATYRVAELNEEGIEVKVKTATTNENGVLTVKDLYLESEYSIEEIKSPKDYKISEEQIRIKAHVDSEGKITVEKLRGETKGEIETQGHTVKIKVEDEVKGKLKIKLTDKATNEPIKNAKYRIRGKEVSKIVITDENGEAQIEGMILGEEYTVEQLKADGYYTSDSIKVKIKKNEGTYEKELVEGTAEVTLEIAEDKIPVIKIEMENDKKQVYTLDITKIKKTIEGTTEEGAEQNEELTYLAGAKFKLYKDNKEIGEYVTDGNGKIIIENLYQYVAMQENQEKGEYTLKETVAPVGYTKSPEITFVVEEVEGELKFITKEGKELLYTAEEGIIHLIIEDVPNFRLIKKDGETKKPIAGVKFAIYNTETNSQEIITCKGEQVGTKETINGKEYYVVETDVNGEITIDLPHGFYKAVEVEAPTQYDISNQTYYFGIGESKEIKEKGIAQWVKTIPASIYNTGDSLNNVKKATDGGIVIGKGRFLAKCSKTGEIEWEKEGTYVNALGLTSDGGVIVEGTISGESGSWFCKYDKNGNVEWKKLRSNSSYYIKDIIETSDGEYIAVGYKYNAYGIIVKIDSQGEVIKEKTISGRNY